MKNEMSRRQFLGFAGSAAAVLGLGLVGCGGSAGSGSSASGDAAEVYFLQFKPEVDKEWKEIAKAYKKEKGVEVKIVTAASNTYEEKLKSEMSKSSAPTLFQVNGPTGLKNWKDYCADLSDTKLRGELIDDSLALQSDGKDVCIDWVQESFGIIYNKLLLEKAGYKAEDIIGRHHRMFVAPAEVSSSEYQIFWERLSRGEYFADEYKRMQEFSSNSYSGIGVTIKKDDASGLYAVAVVRKDTPASRAMSISIPA